MAPANGPPPKKRDRVLPALYPVYGVIHFVTHPYLYPFLRARLIPAFVLSTAVIIVLFIFAYLPQAAFLAIFHGGYGALINAAFLVLGEGATVTAILFECFLADEAMVNVFDAVLVERGCTDLVLKGRIVKDVSAFDEVDQPNPAQALGPIYHFKSSVYSPFSFRQIAEFVLLLPLNLIPWIGVPAFLWLTGYRAGPLHHYRYFKLKDLKRSERKAAVRSRRLAYTSFGCMSLVLQLVPVLSMLFLLTTAAGSALWAADLEAKEREHSAAASSESSPPEYSDDVDDPV